MLTLLNVPCVHIPRMRDSLVFVGPDWVVIGSVTDHGRATTDVYLPQKQQRIRLCKNQGGFARFLFTLDYGALTLVQCGLQ